MVVQEVWEPLQKWGVLAIFGPKKYNLYAHCYGLERDIQSSGEEIAL